MANNALNEYVFERAVSVDLSMAAKPRIIWIVTSVVVSCSRRNRAATRAPANQARKRVCLGWQRSVESRVKDGIHDDAPGPFETVFVFAFGEAFFEVFPLAFVKIARVDFFHC